MAIRYASVLSQAQEEHVFGLAGPEDEPKLTPGMSIEHEPVDDAERSAMRTAKQVSAKSGISYPSEQPHVPQCAAADIINGRKRNRAVAKPVGD